MRLLRRLLANWPLKLTSVLLAILLWVISTLEEPITRRVRAHLEFEVPVDRAVVGAPATAMVQLTAPAREFIKLGDRQVTVLKTLSDSGEGVHTVDLTPTDVVLPRGITARAIDVEPGQFSLRMIALGGAVTRERAWHGIPVAVPGPVELRWLPVPDTVTVMVRGPLARLEVLDAESLIVIARPDTAAGAAVLRVIAPQGLTAESHPAAIRLQARRP